MRFDIPHLGSMPAFEAAARLKSFTKAAEELCVTQAAISFQVRNLERALGTKLFVRRHRALEVTPKGRSLMMAVQSAFTILADEKALITGTSQNDAVTITAPISFSGKWLVPRLRRLYATISDTGLRIDANDSLVDLEHQGVQLAIRYCADPPAGVAVEKLLDDVVFPVCNPQLLRALGRPITSANLGELTLLRDQMTDFTWEDWFETVGFEQDKSAPNISFSHTASAIDAAISGQGYALGRLSLVSDDLEAGRLVRPFPETRTTSYSYYLIQSDEVNERSSAAAISKWLISEAAQTTLALQNIRDA